MTTQEQVNGSEIDGLYAAQYFKYCLQFSLSYIVEKLEFRRVAAKSLYAKHKKEFDSLVAIFKKYNIDVKKYIEFFTGKYGKVEKDIKSDLVATASLSRFIEHLQAQEKSMKVYRWFMKSANNIADECIANGTLSAKDYIRDLIRDKKLAAYYLTGRISRYWIAGIPKFKHIIKKLDQMSRDELQDVYDKFDIYNSEINEAFLFVDKRLVNPIKITDELIFKKSQLSK